MKAVVYHGKKNIKIEDVPEPECGPEGVKVEVNWCGICGGISGHIFSGQTPIIQPSQSSGTNSLDRLLRWETASRSSK